MGHLSSYVQKRSQFIFQLIVNKSINEVKNEWFPNKTICKRCDQVLFIAENRGISNAITFQ